MRLIQRLRAVAPANWLLLAFLLLLAIFLVFLTMTPGAVGRGGR